MTPPSLHRFSHQAMGTFFEVTIAGEETSYAGQAAQAAFNEIDRLERLFSRFDPTSEIRRIGRLRPGESLMIGHETYECLTAAEKVRVETDGAFDINVRRAAKYGPAAGTGAGDGPAKGSGRILTLARTDRGFEVLRAEQADAPWQPLDLDLGAIGKGYALDKALAILADWSIENALVHGGTSTAAAVGNAPETKGWPVGVGGGWPSDGPREIALSGRALSGSGTEVKGPHVIDPRTGEPAKGHLAAWAMHRSACVADALSTAFMVMDTAEVEAYCGRHPDVWALVVKNYGDCRAFGEQ